MAKGKTCKSTVKLVYNDHVQHPKFVAVVDRRSMFKSSFIVMKIKFGTPKMWSL